LAKPNYQFEKRQRDLAKKSKQEEKRRQKLADTAAANDNSQQVPAHPFEPTPTSAGGTAVASPENGTKPKA
jgi:hypothetical protein